MQVTKTEMSVVRATNIALAIERIETERRYRWMELKHKYEGKLF